MSKYSSESDSNHADDHYRKKRIATKGRGRSRSSSSSNSSHSSRKKYHKHKRYKGHRSQSREKYTKSQSKGHSWRSSRDRSRSPTESRSRDHKSSKLKKKYKRRSSSRSVSKSRYRNRSISRSLSKGKSRSRSKSYQRSPSQSSRDTQPLKLKPAPLKQDDLQDIISKSRTKQPSDHFISDNLSCVNVLQKNDCLKAIEVIDVEPSSTAIDKINSPGFEQRPFLSGKNLNPTFTPEVIEVPDKDNGGDDDDDDPRNLFNSRLFADHQKMEKWVKKLFNLRQKAINGEPII